jgi:predicted HicB family RNase H-like nuclease
MTESTETCTRRFELRLRPREHEILRAKAEREGITASALIRSRIPEIFEPASPGRRWSDDPTLRRRKNG